MHTHKIQTIKRLVKQVNVCKFPFTIKKPTKIPLHHWVCFILVIFLVWCLIWRVFNVHSKSHSNFFYKRVPIAGNILGMGNYASLMLWVLGCHLAWTCAGFVYTLSCFHSLWIHMHVSLTMSGRHYLESPITSGC